MQNFSHLCVRRGVKNLLKRWTFGVQPIGRKAWAWAWAWFRPVDMEHISTRRCPPGMHTQGAILRSMRLNPLFPARRSMTERSLVPQAPDLHKCIVTELRWCYVTRQVVCRVSRQSIDVAGGHVDAPLVHRRYDMWLGGSSSSCWMRSPRSVSITATPRCSRKSRMSRSSVSIVDVM